MKQLALMMTLVSSVACSGDAEPNDEPDGLFDPYADLRATVPVNGIRCDAEACCWDDCNHDQVVCGQQNGLYAAVGSTLDGYDLDSTPDWWRTNRFYLVSNYEMNVLAGRTDTDRPTWYYVAGYCETASFHTAYSFLKVFDDASEFDNFLAEGLPSYECSSAFDSCDGFCIPSCVGRECGSDGCGGSCGGCSTNETCVSGDCTTGNSGNACDQCISTCSGLPGCCQGCGCMCEDECGGCI